MDTGPDSPDFIGRKEELRAIEHFLVSGREQVLIIYGQRGCGKTALVRYALKDYISLGIQSVVYINAANVSSLGHIHESILKSLRPKTSFAELSQSNVQELVLRTIREKAVLIVIDDIDALPQETAAEIISGLYTELSKNNQKLKVILISSSARLSDLLVSKMLVQIRYVTLGLLSMADVHKMIESRLSDSIPKSAAKKIAQLTGGNPLLIRLILDFLREHGDSALESIIEGTVFREDLKSKLIEVVFRDLSRSNMSILGVLSKFETPPRLEDLRALSGMRDRREFDSAIQHLEKKGLIRVDNWGVEFTHKLLRGLVAEISPLNAAERSSGTLYITFDPTVVSKGDILNMLLNLNEIYGCLGGNELIIRDEEVGVFVGTEEVVFS